MIKSISYWSMPDGMANTHPIDDALRRAKAAGFQGLELAVGPSGVITPDLSESDCRVIRNMIDGSGVKVETLASGMSWAFNPTSNDPAIREQSISRHAAALQRAAWLGCKAMLFVPGVVASPVVPGEVVRYDHAVERARVAVSRLLDVAERVGVDLCIENVWNGLFYSPIEFAAFLDEFKSARLGMYFDCGNVLGYHQHPPHWIELLGTRIKRVHIKDYRLEFGWDGRYSFCPLGKGDVPWNETIAALRGIGYSGTIVAEMMPYREGLLEETSEFMGSIL